MNTRDLDERVRLCWINPSVGGVKGEKIFKKICEAKIIFFDNLGVQKINESCEKLRINFLEALSEDRVHNLIFTKDEVNEQLSLPFELNEAKTIEVELCETIPKSCHCMEALPNNKIEEGIYRLKVYIKTLWEEDGEFYWHLGHSRLSVKDNHFYVEPAKYFTVETAVFHEFLHISGDACWFGRADGIIRPNLIGLNAILDLLEKHLKPARVGDCKARVSF